MNDGEHTEPVRPDPDGDFADQALTRLREYAVEAQRARYQPFRDMGALFRELDADLSRGRPLPALWGGTRNEAPWLTQERELAAEYPGHPRQVERVASIDTLGNALVWTKFAHPGDCLDQVLASSGVPQPQRSELAGVHPVGSGESVAWRLATAPVDFLHGVTCDSCGDPVIPIVTTTGRVLRTPDLEALATEAEAGYHLTELTPAQRAAANHKGAELGRVLGYRWPGSGPPEPRSFVDALQARRRTGPVEVELNGGAEALRQAAQALKDPAEWCRINGVNVGAGPGVVLGRVRRDLEELAAALAGPSTQDGPEGGQ